MIGMKGRHIGDQKRSLLRRELLENPNESGRLIADRVGVSKGTAEKERRALRDAGISTIDQLPPLDSSAAQPSLPPEAPTPEHELRIFELEENLRKANLRIRELQRDGLDDNAIKRLLGVIADAPPAPPEWLQRVRAGSGETTPEVPVVSWCDWHLGEVVEPAEVNGVNAYNIEIAERRVRRLFDSVVDIAQNHGPGNYPGIVVNLLGDFVSGALHPELAKTDEEEVIPATLRCRDLLIAGLKRMADTFGRVYAPCAAGNHGRATQKPEFKRYAVQNFDWLIYQLLIRYFEEQDDKRVVIDVRPANEVHYQVYGKRFLAMHGDMLGVKGGDGIIGAIGPIARGETKVGKQSSQIGRDYDYLLIGHWHQMLWLPRVIVAGTLKGFDEYAKNALRAPVAEPSQPMFFVHPRRGITARWELTVDEPRQAAKEWVTWSA